MLKIRSIYYRLPNRRTMDDVKMIEDHIIASQLKRIADVLERLLKISEMSL